jgi:phage shock protein PspC (stress-responsive transcriptional regulator)
MVSGWLDARGWRVGRRSRRGVLPTYRGRILGAMGSVGAGIALFGEPADAVRLLFVTVTVVGIAGLKLTG